MSAGLVLLTLAGAHLLAVMSPGPSFVVVLRETLSGSTRTGLMVSLGMSLGALLWALAAWFGLAALFAAAPWLFAALRWGGALFLLWLAVGLWRAARRPAASAPDAPGRGLPDPAALRLGLLTQLANPKVAVFFGSIFVVLLPPDASPGLQAAVFAVIALDEFLWYALVARLMSSHAARARYARAKPLLDRLAGTFLGLLGLRIAMG